MLKIRSIAIILIEQSCKTIRLSNFYRVTIISPVSLQDRRFIRLRQSVSIKFLKVAPSARSSLKRSGQDHTFF